MGLALRSRTAANSSSAKNALPPERRKICSTSSAAGLPPTTALQQLCDLVTIEAIDIQPVNPLAAVQFGEEGTDRMAAVQVVGAVGQHQE